jgi:hypothetical protein
MQGRRVVSAFWIWKSGWFLTYRKSPLNTESFFSFLIHSQKKFSVPCLTPLPYIQLTVLDMSTYDGSDVDIIFAGGGTAACMYILEFYLVLLKCSVNRGDFRTSSVEQY